MDDLEVLTNILNKVEEEMVWPVGFYIIRVALLDKLGQLPGAAEVRERLAVMFVAPMWKWAAPLLQPPPAALAASIQRAVTHSRSARPTATRNSP